jgi:hypothetical protein
MPSNALIGWLLQSRNSFGLGKAALTISSEALPRLGHSFQHGPLFFVESRSCQHSALYGVLVIFGRFFQCGISPMEIP